MSTFGALRGVVVSVGALNTEAPVLGVLVLGLTAVLMNLWRRSSPASTLSIVR